MNSQTVSSFISEIPLENFNYDPDQNSTFRTNNQHDYYENSFNQNFFLLRQQSGRVKRHAYSYVFLLRPPLPKARSRGGRQFFHEVVWRNR